MFKVSNVPNLLISEAHVLTDGLAGAESRMIGIIGLHHKAARERHFPLRLLEKGLKVKIEETWCGIARNLCCFVVWRTNLLENEFMNLDDRLHGQGPWSIVPFAC